MKCFSSKLNVLTIVIIVAWILTAGVAGCSIPQTFERPDNQIKTKPPPSAAIESADQLQAKILEHIKRFFDRFDNFATAAAQLVKETNFLQNHPYWQDFATHLRQELAKAYVDGKTQFDFSWPVSGPLTSDEQRFSQRVVTLFTRSKLLDDERMNLIREWPHVKLYILLKLNKWKSPILKEAWYQKASDIEAILYGYARNDVGMFIRQSR